MKYLTTGEVARRLGVDNSTVRRWLLDPVECRQRFPNLQRTVGGHARIAEVDVSVLSTDVRPSGTALLYARVPHARHRDLLDLGVAHLRRYAKQRGFEVLTVVEEVGAGFSDRPVLCDIRNQIKGPGCPFDVLVVERLDRLVLLGAKEFIRWADPVRVEVAGASCDAADNLYQEEVLIAVYYPLADALALRGYSPVDIERILMSGLEGVAEALGL